MKCTHERNSLERNKSQFKRPLQFSIQILRINKEKTQNPDGEVYEILLPTLKYRK